MENVDSEHPRLHWKYIECKDKVAVDLGCGRWEHMEKRDSDWPTTPEYLLQIGASNVYAFDMDQNEINWYNANICSNNEKIKAACVSIDNVDKIRSIYNTYNPKVIKCDIEFHEFVLLQLTDDEFSSVDFYAIETHTDDLYNKFIDRFAKLDYEIVAVINLIHAPPMKAIFARKN